MRRLRRERHVLVRQQPVRAALSLLVLLPLLLALAGCASTSTALLPPATPSSPAAGPTPLPTPPLGPRPSPVVGLLGPVPTDCVAMPPPQTLTVTDFGGGFSGTTAFAGAAPAWELGLGTGALHLNGDGAAVPYPATKVMWVVGPDDPEPVTLSGHELHTGAPLWFQLYPSNAIPTDDPDALTAYTTQAVLDPAAPNRGTAHNQLGNWTIWGIGLLVLAAGCYTLDVAAATASWRTVFAAGR